MKIEDFIAPLENGFLPDSYESTDLAAFTEFYLENYDLSNLMDFDMAIIGCNEDRLSDLDCENAPNAVRKHLYQLKIGDFLPKLIDLGNIKKGNTAEDTHFGLSFVLSKLISQNVLPIVIGGTQDLTTAIYHAYSILSQKVNLACVDARFDLGDPEEKIRSNAFLSQILLETPSYLHTYSNIGLQSYLNDIHSIKLIENMNFEILRLGLLHQNISDAEPFLRNSHILSFDVASIRKSDFPASKHNFAVGLTGEEASQICRYAGSSNRISSFGIFDFETILDKNNISSELIAVMIWCFIDGFYSRFNELNICNTDDYVKVSVIVDNAINNEIVFYRSLLSERWWFEVAHHKKYEQDGNHLYLLPCTKGDYDNASRNIIPKKYLSALERFAK
ncbi:MAG: formimidoylglutamase [Bacteroidales bacterium]|jgi:arginase family enzyme|nr:formimidoylglutamase [Bacteroidales bacterium]